MQKYATMSINPLINILYEDNHLVIVNKKSGDIVQGDKTGDTPLSQYVKEYVQKKYNKPGEAFIGVIHRLDRPVSGIVVFARTSKALARMNELFKTKNITKTYWAIVENRPTEAEGKLVHYLSKNEKLNKSFVSKTEKSGYKRAELNYKVLASSDNYHLLEIELMTGRHHQIRVQLSTIGCVIKGDLKYGAKRNNMDASISLHSRKISFVHPVKNESLTVTASPPNESLWNYFLSMVE